MALKVYGLPLSAPTVSVLTVLAEKGVDYELVPIDLSKGEHKSPDYLAKNPFGKVPALEDGSLVLFESRAITKYLAEKYKGQGTDLLKHDNIEEAALVGVWVEVESQYFAEPATAIIFQHFVAPIFGRASDQSIIDASVEKLGAVLDVYEKRLSNSKYLAGDSFTLADLNHLPQTCYIMQTPYADVINSRPHVKAWWEDISARPTFVKLAPGLKM